jgi:MFS family permease
VQLLLLSSFASSTAVLAQTTALGKHVYDITGSKLDLGLIGLAEFLPSALLVLVSGPVADRFDRRRVGAIALAGEAAAAAGLFLYARSDPTSVWPIFALVVLFGVARAFATPAIRALPPSVVPSDELPQLVAFYSISWQSATVVGPVAAGFLYEAGPQWPYAFSAVLFLAAIGGVSFVRLRADLAPPDRSERPTVHAALEGLRFVRASPILFACIALDLFAVLFGGAVALLPAIAEDRLGVGAVGFGWLRAAGGIGAGLTALALALRPIKRGVGPKLLVAVAIFGATTIVLGLTRSFVVAMLSMAVLSAADMVSVFIRGTIVPLATPDAMRGRVLAVEHVFIGASNELGAFESGVAGQALGTVGAVVSGGIATLLIVAIWSTKFPALRRIDTFAEVHEETERAVPAAERPAVS